LTAEIFEKITQMKLTRFLFDNFKGWVHCFSMQVVMNDAF